MTILEEFDAFLQQKSKNYKMKFIFLVRDPRGIFNSRLRISKVQYHEKGTEKNIAKKLGAHCQKISDNIKFIQNSPFWSERTMIVRYEDVAVEPKKFAKKLYGNIGLYYINDIDQWIDDNTHSKGKIFKFFKEKKLGSGFGFRFSVQVIILGYIKKFWICGTGKTPIRHIIPAIWKLLEIAIMIWKSWKNPDRRIWNTTNFRVTTVF